MPAQLPDSATTLRGFDYLILLVSLVLVPSGVIHGLLGWDEKWIFAALAPLVILGALMTKRPVPPPGALLLVGTLILLGIVSSFVADSYSQFLMSLSLCAAVIVGYQVCLTLSKSVALRIATGISVLLLIGGIVGLIYYFIGGQSLLDVQVGYRRTGLYLTTFSFAKIGKFIRPSGIFDEPGAFAMYVAIVTMFNDMLQQNRRLNVALVVLMTFTGSLAGLFLACLYFMTSNTIKANRARSAALAAAIVAGALVVNLALPTNPVSMAVHTFYSDRIRVVDGRLVGDNRSDQVNNFFRLVDQDILVRGAKASGTRYVEDLTSNPFSITFGYGLLISLPYFLVLAWLAVVTMRNRLTNMYSSAGMLILLLQRPYLYNMSWSILIAACIWLIHLRSREIASTSRAPAPAFTLPESSQPRRLQSSRPWSRSSTAQKT